MRDKGFLRIPPLVLTPTGRISLEMFEREVFQEVVRIKR